MYCDNNYVFILLYDIAIIYEYGCTIQHVSVMNILINVLNQPSGILFNKGDQISKS